MKKQRMVSESDDGILRLSITPCTMNSPPTSPSSSRTASESPTPSSSTSDGSTRTFRSSLASTVAPAAATAPVHRKRQVKVPRNKQENRELKKGHVEDNNEDISYFRVPILFPSMIFTIGSLLCFGVAIGASVYTDYKPNGLELRHGFVIKYGSSRYRCNSSLPYPVDGLPSILNLFEINVIGNVLFRFCTAVPIAVRLFHAICIRYMLRLEYEDNLSFLFRTMNDLIPVLTGIETLSMALFGIITVHNDFPEFNRFCKTIFTMCSAVNMFITTIMMFSYSRSTRKRWDTFSITLKLFVTALYCYLTPQYFQHHHSSITFPVCHSYLPRVFAYMEYALATCYLLFHCSILIDIRYVTFMCYPRSCSGECEPLDPKNFEKGGKYEHCRAYEYNQLNNPAFDT